MYKYTYTCICLYYGEFYKKCQGQYNGIKSKVKTAVLFILNKFDNMKKYITMPVSTKGDYQKQISLKSIHSS